eukprot:SAG31_NODE_2118_length_6410_cov_3.846142_2_plen_247_part_00
MSTQSSVQAMLLALGAVIGANVCNAALTVPPHTPDVWGGAAYGAALGHSSHLFAFSGADGPTKEGSGFTGLLRPELYSVQFGDTVLDLRLDNGVRSADAGNGTLLAATSDVIAVASSSGPDARSAESPELLLTFSAWNLLFGYSPDAALRKTESKVTSGLGSTGHCNLTGFWKFGARSYSYHFQEAADGSFTVTSPAGSWRAANGQRDTNGSITITFALVDGHTFTDHAVAPVNTVLRYCRIILFS